MLSAPGKPHHLSATRVEFRANGITQFVLCSVWLLLLSIIILMFVRVVSVSRLILFLLLARVLVCGFRIVHPLIYRCEFELYPC